MAINCINKKDNKCFQIALTVTLNHKEIGRHAERIIKIKLFINKYKCEGINFPSEKDDWKTFEKNNVTISRNVLHARKEKISHAYVSKNNSHREKQVIFLKIPNGEEWHYFAVKIPSTLLRRITSKHYGDFYCMNCLNFFRTKNKLESHKRVCENKDFCSVIMPSEDTKILELNQYQKYDKAPFINHADLECIIEKIDGCKKDPKNSSIQAKVREHIPPGFSMSTISSFRRIENKQYV